MENTFIDGASCKAVNGPYGEFFNVSFNLEKLQQYANEKGYVNMTMSKRREPGQYGDTHYFKLNNWKPEGGNTSAGNNASAPAENDDISVEDLPF